jgi:hypothetical protein
MPLCSRRIRAVEELILAVTKGISRVQLSLFQTDLAGGRGVSVAGEERSPW